MEYQFNEIPSGVVDWVNKTFTVINEIYRIEDFYLGNAPYRNIAFSWNVITLAEAPPIWAELSVDYFWLSGTPSPSSQWVTLWGVINDVYEKIGNWQKRTMSGQPNKVYKEWQIKLSIISALAHLRNIMPRRNNVLQYNFNYIKWLSAKGYNANYVTIWEIVWVPSSGVYVISNSTIWNYNTYSSWRLNGAIWVNYKSWDKVLLWYKIPSWVKKVSEVLIDWIALKYVDQREYTISSHDYTIVKWDDWLYLVLPYLSENWICTVNYIPDYWVPTNDGDILDIEYEYTNLLSYCALYDLYSNLEDTRVNMAKQRYDEELKKFNAHKSLPVAGINNSFSWKPIFKRR